jgi:hypothetical protein
MSQFKKGAAALNALTSQSSGNSPTSEFTKFKSGTTLKVKVKGTEDIMQYYGYGVFKKVNTFVAKNPSVRNERGYVIENPTPWDKASQYYYDQANKLLEGINDENEIKAIKESAKYKALTSEGYKYAGKERYAMGFFDLTTGKDIVVDLTKNQALAVYEIIVKYEKKLDKIAFELSKTGARNEAKVTLTPIIDMDEDLTDEERKNFEAAVGQPFNHALFDGLLYEADEKEQIENLVAAGFDISLIGLSLGGNDSAENNDDPTTQF